MNEEEVESIAVKLVGGFNNPNDSKKNKNTLVTLETSIGQGTSSLNQLIASV